jgi:hypothetical protein
MASCYPSTTFLPPWDDDILPPGDDTTLDEVLGTKALTALDEALGTQSAALAALDQGIGTRRCSKSMASMPRARSSLPGS